MHMHMHMHNIYIYINVILYVQYIYIYILCILDVVYTSCILGKKHIAQERKTKGGFSAMHMAVRTGRPGMWFWKDIGTHINMKNMC